VPGAVIRGCPACLLDHLEHVLIIQGESDHCGLTRGITTHQFVSVLHICQCVYVEIDGVAYTES
jgi:hypothetical protein